MSTPNLPCSTRILSSAIGDTNAGRRTCGSADGCTLSAARNRADDSAEQGTAAGVDRGVLVAAAATRTLNAFGRGRYTVSIAVCVDRIQFTASSSSECRPDDEIDV